MAKETKQVELPKVEPKPVDLKVDRPAPTDDQFTDGAFVKVGGVLAGEKFILCKHEPNGYEHTHSLKNSLHFWQGTEAEFRANFEKA